MYVLKDFRSLLVEHKSKNKFGNDYIGIIDMFQSMCINLVGLGMIYNNNYFDIEFIKSYDKFCYLPLEYIHENKVLRKNDVYERWKFYGTIMNYMNFHLSECYKYNFDKTNDLSNCFALISEDLDTIKNNILGIINKYQHEFMNIKADNISKDDEDEIDTKDYFLDILRHSLEGNGKMIRPTFILYANRMLMEKGYSIDKKKILNFCVSVELTHLASLIHDDIIDEANIRRGKDSCNHKFGNKIAVLLGDYLITEGTKLLFEAGIENIVCDSIGLTQRLIRGEVNEIKNCYKKIGFNTYLNYISDKTAYFVGWIFKITGVLMNCNTEYIEVLEMLGHYIGLVFQITDDILDYQGLENMTGKPVLNDLIKGIVTAPYIFAMEENPDLSSYLLFIEKHNIKKDELKKNLDKYDFNKYNDLSKKYACEFLDVAIEILEANFNEGIYRSNMKYLIEHILNREK